MAVRGRAFLSEHADDNRFRYYKGGLSETKPTVVETMRWVPWNLVIGPAAHWFQLSLNHIRR